MICQNLAVLGYHIPSVAGNQHSTDWQSMCKAASVEVLMKWFQML